MNKCLTLSFFAILCLVTCQDPDKKKRKNKVWYEKDYRYCEGCHSVDPFNQCLKRPYRCIAKKSEYCFNRIVSKGGLLLFVDRGCISNCIHMQYDGDYKNFTWCCRTRDYCNQYNFWPSDLPPEPLELS